MKKENENIDCLLGRNAQEQLVSFDWERLNKSISEKLDEVDKTRDHKVNYGYLFKAAAGIAVAAAALVIIVVLLRTEPQRPAQFENDGKAVVKIIENAGSASVEIKQKSAETMVVVDTQVNRENLVVCDVEIIDSNGDKVTNQSRPAWIIIRVPEPVLVDTGKSRDQADLACLL